MNKSVAIKPAAAWAGKAFLISMVALLSSALSVLLWYQTVPVPLVSTSPQNAAMSIKLPFNGKESGVNCCTAV